MIHGPVLVADLFCAIDIVDQANVARALENELEKVTRRHGCRAVHTNLPSSGSKGAEDWLVPVLYERGHRVRSEEHTSELQSLMRISYAVFCLKKKKITTKKQAHS